MIKRLHHVSGIFLSVVLAGAVSAQAASVSPACVPTSEPLPELVYARNDRDSFGYRRADGTWLLPIRKWRSTYRKEFSDYGYVWLQGFYIDTDARIVRVPYHFNNAPDLMAEGLFRFVHDLKVGFSDRCMNEVIPARYDWATPFNQGVAIVCNGCGSTPVHPGGEHFMMTGGKWGAID